VVAIVGEAGVGKSRLVYEFTHSHRVQDWLILDAPSVSYGKATSYLPVIDLLKGYFKIQDRDDLREIRAKVTGKLSQGSSNEAPPQTDEACRASTGRGGGTGLITWSEAEGSHLMFGGPRGD
jgi:adenylate kinase